MRVRVWSLLFALLVSVGGFLWVWVQMPTLTSTVTPVPAPARSPKPVSTATPIPQPPITLRWTLDVDEDLESFDPALIWLDAELDIARQLFLGLTATHPRTGEAIPDLATHWDIGDGGRVYTFYLRSDVQWMYYHPDMGRPVALRPVTAHDVVYSLRRAIDPKTEAIWSYALYIIENAEAINSTPPNSAYDVETLGVAALDDYAVRFTLERPAATLPAILALPVAWPVPRGIVELHGAQWTALGRVVTNGPYVLTEWERGKHLTLIKNPSYYAADDVQIEQVECVVASAEQARLLYESGEIDSIRVSGDSMRDWARAYVQDQHVQPDPYTMYYVFDTTRPPFDNVHARRAFSLATDRQAYLDALGVNGLTPANTFSSPALPGWPGDAARPNALFDPQRAREELALAGYPGGQGVPQVRLLVAYPTCFGPTESQRARARALQSIWQEHLGITVTLEEASGLWLGSAPPLDSQLWYQSWYADYVDVASISDRFSSEGGLGLRTIWLDPANAEFQRLRKVLADIVTELDPARRQDLYREAEQLLCVDVCVAIPFYHYTQTWLTKPYLHRDYPAMGGQNFKDWRIEPQ